MSFRVLWLPRAEQQLAAIWMEVEDKLAINNAANAIDLALSDSPHLKGESRDAGRRIIACHHWWLCTEYSQKNGL
jgi:hypothetical protein